VVGESATNHGKKEKEKGRPRKSTYGAKLGARARKGEKKEKKQTNVPQDCWGGEKFVAAFTVFKRRKGGDRCPWHYGGEGLKLVGGNPIFLTFFGGGGKEKREGY